LIPCNNLHKISIYWIRKMHAFSHKLWKNRK
jgi:hypothetical protein